MNLTVAPGRRLTSMIGVGMLAALAVTGTGTATPGSSVHAAGAVPSPISDLDVTQAGIGVLAFGLRNLEVDPITEPCPVLRQDQVGWYFAQQGFTANFAEFGVDVYYEDEVGEGYPGVDCLSRIEDAVDPDPAAPHYPGIGAAYLPDGTTFQDFLSGFEDQTILTPSVPGVAGEIGGVCIQAFCYLHWHRGSLVVSLLVAGGSGDITREKSEAMLTAMVPDVVANLKASMDTGAPVPSSLPTPSVPAPTKTIPG